MSDDSDDGEPQVARADGSPSNAQVIQAGAATAQAGQGVAAAAQSGDPASAVGAASQVAGATSALAGASGSSGPARDVAQAAGTAQQAGGVMATATRVASPQASAPASASAPVRTDGAAGTTSLLADAAQAVADALSGGQPLDEPFFELKIVKGPEIQWHVQRFAITSELSRAYEIHLDLVCDNTSAPVDEMLGASCELIVERGDLVHTFYGIIDEIDDIGPDQGRLHASIRVVPAFAMLADVVDTRIFQGQTVVEILTEVLTEALAPYEREVNASDCLKRTYHPRDYCTQFRESTFEFCCRLMEEEGIAFRFESDDGNRREMLILVDNNNDCPPVVLAHQEEIPVIDSNPEDADVESVRGVLWRQRRHINKVVGRAYNFKAADTFEEAEAALEDPHHHHDRELYLHDLRRQITDDPIGDQPAESYVGTDIEQRKPLVEQTLEEYRAQTKTAYGRGNVTGFRPGSKFQLGAHHRGDLDGAELLLVRTIHHGEANTENAGSTASYSNEFSAIPVTHEYRPPQRHVRAYAHGPLLARVVGAPGSDDDIHIDKFGRIKVQFHHDRRQPADASASVWMRVVQPWAGAQWGTFFIPRVGMEVVVQFVDGNPDNPVVTGCVYNSQNMPPYEQPGEKTKSTIKSSSSIGGDGYNEMTFEDAKGAEQIIVHAQKDFNKTVRNNQSRSVGANDSTSVGGNQSLAVKKDRTHTIEGNETITITGSQMITINGASTGEGQTVTGGQLNITGKYKVDATEKIDVQAPQHIKFQVGSSYILIEPAQIVLQAQDGARVVLSPANALMASKENSQIKLTADAQVQANTGGDLTLTANAQLTGQKAQVLLDGTALVKAAAGAELKLDADAKIIGANATMDAKTSSTVSAGSTATLTAAGSTVKVSGSAAEMAGPQANVAGQGAVNITGGIIKLN